MLSLIKSRILINLYGYARGLIYEDTHLYSTSCADKAFACEYRK
ncbi:hypothetical protein [Candidatus Lariskella endosymbiont of Epinotia ramella]